MDTSIFTDKTHQPEEKDLKKALGTTYDLWQSIASYVRSKYSGAKEEWNYPGQKFGWSYRIKDKKRAIVYLLPRDRFFKAAFVFGHKATTAILQSDISPQIKQDLEAARAYTEGRGIQIDVKNKTIIPDIQELVDIKLAN